PYATLFRSQVDAHERVDRLRRRVEDVDETLVRAHLEVFARVLVLVRRTDDAVHVLLGRQRHRSDHAGPGAGDRLHDLARRRVDRLVVIGLEPDADLLSRHAKCPFLRFPSWPGNRQASVPPSFATARTHERRLRETTDRGHARSSPLFICHGSPVHAVGRVAFSLILRPGSKLHRRLAERVPDVLAPVARRNTHRLLLSPCRIALASSGTHGSGQETTTTP